MPVTLRPAATGCPMRCGAEEQCRRAGGPWTSASITASLVWSGHRAMLLDALDCAVCKGEPIAQGQPIGLRQLFSPTREGGWAWGRPQAG